MKTLWTSLVADLLFPAQEALKRHQTVSVCRGLEDSQWWSTDRIERLQLARLKALLTEAGSSVPYYRQLFSRLGFEPTGVRSTQDLSALPLLDKATIRQHRDALRHDRAVGLARFNTGGSSGEPLIFFIGRERVSHDVAAKWRATRWWGVDIGDPEIVVWGSPIELGTQDRVRQLRDALMRTELLPAFEMNETKLDHFIKRIRQRRPRMLFGYPSALAHIAQHARHRGVALDDLGVRVVFVTSERLYDEQRHIIEHTFGCPVANGYGGRDAGFIAHECPRGSLHITAEDILVEIVDPASGQTMPMGQSGEIVVTHLATRDYPFIRYRTGDIGVLSSKSCPCGRGLPVLAEIQGRSTDFVIAEDGTVMHGLALIYVLRGVAGIRSFKIIQHTRSRTQVQIVPEPDFDPADTASLATELRRRLGANVSVEVELVDQIPAEKSGKFRYVVSHVPLASPEKVAHHA